MDILFSYVVHDCIQIHDIRSLVLRQIDRGANNQCRLKMGMGEY